MVDGMTTGAGGEGGALAQVKGEERQASQSAALLAVQIILGRERKLST